MTLGLIRQLDGTRFAGGNCGCVATAHALAWSTRNRFRRTPHQCRTALGGVWVGQQSVPPNNATSLRDQARAWDAFRPVATRRGLTLPRFDVRLLRPWESVRTALGNGNAVMLQIDHATINRRIPRLSGFPTFDGLHVVLITERRTRDGRNQLLDYDGGFDGRVVSGRRVPRGPQWIPEAVMREAAEEKNVISLMKSEHLSEATARDMARGTATFAVIRRATPDILDEGDEQEGEEGEEPAEEDDPTATETELRERVRRLRGALRRSRNHNAALENALGVIQTLLAEATDAAGPDGALAAAATEIDEVLVPPADTGTAIEDGVGPEGA